MNSNARRPGKRCRAITYAQQDADERGQRRRDGRHLDGREQAVPGGAAEQQVRRAIRRRNPSRKWREASVMSPRPMSRTKPPTRMMRSTSAVNAIHAPATATQASYSRARQRGRRPAIALAGDGVYDARRASACRQTRRRSAPAAPPRAPRRGPGRSALRRWRRRSCVDSTSKSPASTIGLPKSARLSTKREQKGVGQRRTKQWPGDGAEHA